MIKVIKYINESTNTSSRVLFLLLVCCLCKVIIAAHSFHHKLVSAIFRVIILTVDNRIRLITELNMPTAAEKLN